MITNIAIAFAISLGVVLLWVLVGASFGGRARREEEEYWTSHEPCCPHCDRTYPPDAVRIPFSAFSEPPYDGMLITCPSCGEIASFARTEGNPRFEGLDTQPRNCQVCDERFNGTPETQCPVCGEVASVLADR